MSGGKHTPGPWLDWDTLEWLRDPQKLLTNTADAHLIAAAPELLEALSDLLDAYEGGSDRFTRAAREAIAKAGA